MDDNLKMIFAILISRLTTCIYHMDCTVVLINENFEDENSDRNLTTKYGKSTSLKIAILLHSM